MLRRKHNGTEGKSLREAGLHFYYKIRQSQVVVWCEHNVGWTHGVKCIFTVCLLGLKGILTST